jgi:hypothetical protein
VDASDPPPEPEEAAAPEEPSEPEEAAAPEEPSGPAVARLGRAAEGYGLAAASWAGRGDEEDGLSLFALGSAAGLFVSLFMPWLGQGANTVSGWNLQLGRDCGLVALAAVLVELLALARAWISRGSELVGFCLVTGAGVLGASAIADLRWGGLLPGGFGTFEYGAWLALVFAVLLLLVAALRLAALWRSAP